MGVSPQRDVQRRAKVKRARDDERIRAWPSMSLFWKVVAVNAIVLIAAGSTLGFTPATVSSTITMQEAATLVAGVCALLVVNLVLMRRTFAPLSRLTFGMASVYPLNPGLRPAEDDDPELAASFNAMADRLERERSASAPRLVTAQEDEQRRITAELHHEAGQHLTALLLTLDRLVGHGDPGVKREAHASREVVRRSLEQLRTLVNGLRPPRLHELRLTAALTWQLGHRAGLTVSPRLDPVPDDVDQSAALARYRIAQECLNVARHAPEADATLPVTAGADRSSCARAPTDPAWTLHARPMAPVFDSCASVRTWNKRRYS
jgi:two-component system sensor histidine kinase UhpB